MGKEEEIEKLKVKIKEKSLVISRVPKNTKEGFISLANQEFCSDYGMALNFIFNQAKEYQDMKNTFFENMNFKLDHIIGLLMTSQESITQEEKPEEKETIKLLSGRKVEKVKGGRKKNNGSTR